MHILKYKILGIPIVIWGLQLLYVVIALALFIVLLKVLNKETSHLQAQILYVIVMIIVNIIWRLAIKKIKLRPLWPDNLVMAD
jgi:hypothetical protein